MQNIARLFSSFNLRHCLQPITDFGGYYQSVSSFYEIFPTSIHEICSIMTIAYAHSIPIRVRGNGHSMNGFSLPREKELLIKSSSLNYYRMESEKTITIGAGVVIWDLQVFLMGKGLSLGVFNGGYAAPTIGGFISAGGLGKNTDILGGFWESVLEITIVTSQGEILRVTRDDALFPWLFGSMGQLGFIAEVKMKIFGKSDPQTLAEGMIPRSIPQDEKYCWFTLFSSLDQEDIALKKLKKFAADYEDFWIPLNFYYYPFNYKNFNPLLVYPGQEKFVAHGAWGKPKQADKFDSNLIRKMDADFHALVLSEKSFRRYIQTEMIPKEMDYRTYFGEEIYSFFFHLKKKLDPLMLINSQTIFTK